MKLSKYRQMRDFKQTREPRGGEGRPRSPRLRFVVQKHAARRLHYDFRLELDGVLKSWAVPKGPSLNPRDRRLAMETEDHPMEYRKFEGKIPEGNYGAGTVMIWDEGYYTALGVPMSQKEESEKKLRSGYKKGHLSFELRGKRLKGEFSLIRMGRSDREWLLIKKQDKQSTDTGDVTEQDTSVRSGHSFEQMKSGLLPLRTWVSNREKPAAGSATGRPKSVLAKAQKNVKPMLASLETEIPKGNDYLFEVKWDGYRAIAEVSKRRVALYSRNQNDFGTLFPVVAQELSSINHTMVLDGEVVVLDDQGRSTFQGIQQLLDGTPKDPVYQVFDILELDGRDLRNEKLSERKAILREHLPTLPHVRYSDHVQGDGERFFELVKERDLEGMIAKLADSPYREAARTREWLKIKTHLNQEVVIAGFTQPRGGRKYFGALVLGVYSGSELVYVGHTGTGFDGKTLRHLHGLLVPIACKNSAFSTEPKTNMPVTWVQPKYVAQVQFQQWTADGKMRAPVFQGLRMDKPPTQVRRELPTRDLPKKLVGKTPAPRHQPRLLSEASASTSEVVVAEHTVKLTNLHKIWWPKDGFTKGDVIEYYRAISPVMLPHLRDRPQSLLRHPDGIEGDSFFQKNFSERLPDWTQTIQLRSRSSARQIRYLLCQNVETLVFMANYGCIEINPWLSRISSIEKPDFIVLDLDPLEVEWGALIDVAVSIRRFLDRCGINGFCKTSGKRGLHVMIPLGARYDYEQARVFAELLANLIFRQNPESTSVERSPAKRRGRVYLDFLQNRRSQTIAAPYSLRPWPGATVSTPLKWSEVNPKLDPSRFNIQTIRKRVDKVGDLWEGMLSSEIDLRSALSFLTRLLERQSKTATKSQ